MIARVAEVYRESGSQQAGPSAAPGTDTADAAAGEPLAPGTQWGRAHLGRAHPRGTFGDVYRARDVRLDRDVALKLLHRRAAPADLESEVISEGRLPARASPECHRGVRPDRGDGGSASGWSSSKARRSKKNCGRADR
jgi:hypothetical protein